MPSAATFFLISSAASSSSRRASVLACSATCLAAGPTPGFSVAGVGMAPPVDELGRGDAEGECHAEYEKRTGPATAARAFAELWPGRGDDALVRLQIRRRLALHPSEDKAWLHPTKE